MKTLFIHPYDPSTEFLHIVYDRINNEYIGDNPIIKFNRECMGI